MEKSLSSWCNLIISLINKGKYLISVTVWHRAFYSFHTPCVQVVKDGVFVILFVALRCLFFSFCLLVSCSEGSRNEINCHRLPLKLQPELMCRRQTYFILLSWEVSTEERRTGRCAAICLFVSLRLSILYKPLSSISRSEASFSCQSLRSAVVTERRCLEVQINSE